MQLHKDFDPIVDRNSVSDRNCLLIIWWKLVVIIAQSYLFTLQYNLIFFSTIKISLSIQPALIFETLVQTAVLKCLPYLYDLKRQKLAQDFAVIRPRNYFFIMTRSDNLLGNCSTSAICHWAYKINFNL